MKSYSLVDLEVNLLVKVVENFSWNLQVNFRGKLHFQASVNLWVVYTLGHGISPKPLISMFVNSIAWD